MGISENDALALRVFPPTILLKPYLDFFQFLAYSEEEITESLIEEKILIEKFYKFCLEFDDETKYFKNNKPLLKSILKENVPKLHNIGFLTYQSNYIGDFNWKKIGKFYDLLKHIEKSDERKIKWALYHYFENNRGKKIQKPIEKIENLVKELKIKNIRKIISKLLKSQESHVSATLEVYMDPDIPLPKSIHRSLIDDLDFTSRRSPRELDSNILDLLDEGSYSNQELSEILDTSKALVSKAMNRLKKDDEIVLSSHGTRGSNYYTTNCDNCPFGTDKFTCRFEAEKEIKNRLKSKFNYEISEGELKSINTNQALLRIRNILRYSQKHQTPKMESNINQILFSIFSNIWTQFEQKQASKPQKQAYFSIDDMIAKMPALYAIGFVSGQQNGASLMDRVFGQVLREIIPKKDQLKLKRDILKEWNKMRAVMKK